MNSDALISKLRDQQDPQADIALLQGGIGCDSVTGKEANFVDFLQVEMQALGLNPDRADFLPGRPNIWGKRAGKGQSRTHGQSLMFAGHTDTVHVRGWEDNWANDPRQSPFAAPEIDGHIWGRGACDLKGGICASLAALRLLDRAGITLANDLSFAFIGDEESGEPGTGISAGAKDFVARVKSGQITAPDFTVYVEPTKLDVYTAQIGFFIADITITGKSAYFGTPEAGVDALKATHSILSEIWSHADQLRALPEHELVGPSDILVTSLNGGGYIAVPGECTLSVIRKLRPGENLDTAVRAFESAVRNAPVDPQIKVEIAYPAGRDHPHGGSPIEIDPAHPAAQSLVTCLKETGVKEPKIDGAPYWSESPFWVSQIGCPTVYCAPGDISVAHTFEERIGVQDYLDSIRAYALFMARHCGVAMT